MINIKCDDKFLNETIVNILEQKKILTRHDHTNKYFFQLIFVQEENFLSCQVDQKIIKFKTPINFNDIFEKIPELVSNKCIQIKNYEFYPYKQVMKNEKDSILLSEIQNMILCHLLLNLDNGIEKIKLIKVIWPNDKDIFFNKLDTHLTNLKNVLASEIAFDLNFSSKSGILKLSVD